MNLFWTNVWSIVVGLIFFFIIMWIVLAIINAIFGNQIKQSVTNIMNPLGTPTNGATPYSGNGSLYGR